MIDHYQRIGGWIREKLNALDIFTFRQISNFTKEDIVTVTEAIEYFPGRIERDEWILQARDLIRMLVKNLTSLSVYATEKVESITTGLVLHINTRLII